MSYIPGNKPLVYWYMPEHALSKSGISGWEGTSLKRFAFTPFFPAQAWPQYKFDFTWSDIQAGWVGEPLYINPIGLIHSPKMVLDLAAHPFRVFLCSLLLVSPCFLQGPGGSIVNLLADPNFPRALLSLDRPFLLISTLVWLWKHPLFHSLAF